MIFSPTSFGPAILCAILWLPSLGAADFSTYLGFQLGSTVVSASKQAGAKVSDVGVIHQRPALIQELDWRPVSPYQMDTTEAGMVEAISLTYGVATKPAVEVAYHSNYGEDTPVLARWEDAEYSHSLVRTGDHASFALIMSLKRLEALARSAIAEAGRLDSLEAPQRALDLEKRQQADTRTVLDKARSVNAPNFRP